MSGIGGFCTRRRVHSLEEQGYQRPVAYLDIPNPVELAELERASLKTLLFAASSTLLRLSLISLRSVCTCLLIACHTSFDWRSSGGEIVDVPGSIRLALCL